MARSLHRAIGSVKGRESRPARERIDPVRSWFLALLVATVVAVPNVGLADATTSTDEAGDERTIRVTIAVKLNVVPGGGAVVTGVTNLPSGAVLIVGLADTNYVARRIPNYYAQSKVSVRRGRFRSERFTDDGGPLNRGRYLVDVSMSAARFQPARVQAIIGRQGQALSGPLVQRSSLGLGKSVSFEQWFVIR